MKAIITIMTVAIMMLGFAGCSKNDNAIPEDALDNTTWEYQTGSVTITLSFSKVQKVTAGSGSSKRTYYEGPGGYYYSTSQGAESGNFTYGLNGISVTLAGDSNFNLNGTYQNGVLLLNGNTFTQTK